MKVELERCGNAQSYCDRCLSIAIRDGRQNPCFVRESEDGSKNLTLVVMEDGEEHTYEITPEEAQLIYEPSRELPALEVTSLPAVGK